MRLKFILLFSFSFLLSFSQSIIFDNLNSSGGKINNENTNITYTFGQPISGLISNNNNIITQGFQQNLDTYGCTDIAACNFNELASNDNGTCIYPDTTYNEINACNSYEWNGQTYTESGTYYNSIQSTK